MSWKRDQRLASTLSSARALPERLLPVEPHAPRFSVVRSELPEGTSNPWKTSGSPLTRAPRQKSAIYLLFPRISGDGGVSSPFFADALSGVAEQRGPWRGRSTVIVQRGGSTTTGASTSSMLVRLLKTGSTKYLVRWALAGVRAAAPLSRQGAQVARCPSSDPDSPDLFAPWRFGARPDGWTMGAGMTGDRHVPVLRAPGGATPPGNSPGSSSLAWTEARVLYRPERQRRSLPGCCCSPGSTRALGGGAVARVGCLLGVRSTQQAPYPRDRAPAKRSGRPRRTATPRK